MEIIVIWIVFALIFGTLGGWIASQKGREVGEGVLLGSLFGPLGVIIEACLPQATAEAKEEAQAQRSMAQSYARSAEVADQDRDREFWRKRQIEEAESLARRQADRAARKLERDEAYRARGVEPGRFAWYRALSDLGQALVLGGALGGVVLVVFVVVLYANS
jgi:hypothetical protein